MKYNPCKNIPVAHMGPTVTRQLLAYAEGENGYTVNFMTGKKGSSVATHSHPHKQVVYMIKGKGLFLCGGEEQLLQAGDTVQVDGDVPHGFPSIEEDSEWLEFFTPVREDFLP